ncbi:MAG TPA: sensor histidine kinase, partial [Anaerolineales bacterium]|nr:sensor histidine kinase [Anaerolineales bacterium]
MDRKTLERLLEIGEQLSRTRSLQPLLHYTMEVAIDLVGAECGYLVWLNDDGSFTYKVCIDQNGQHIPTPDEQISHTILQDVIQQKSPLVVYDAMSDPGLQNSQSVTDLKLRSVLCVPLISKGEALGGFYVENRSQSNLFTEDDIQPLEFLASQVTAAIENALLNEDLERRIANRTAELEQALQKVEQSLEDALELDRMRTTFFAMVAHDIRAPLTTIIFALNLLREEIWANC